jgi:hypothetical protein
VVLEVCYGWYWAADALAAAGAKVHLAHPLVAGARAKAGQHKQAETIARSITDPLGRAQVLTAVAGALAEVGQHEQAETIARSITDPHRQAQALAAVAKALMAWGDRRVSWHLRRVLSDIGPQCWKWCCRWSHQR